ncbi:MAG TPA: hypothetical protein VG841_07095 [Caulobacterales bacterium]|nr:hypothetical protein [Caulobacterales bacterium]
MKLRLVSAAALALVLVSTSAYAETAQFRSVAPQAFSAAELQSYGLDAATAQRAQHLQSQGYKIKVLTPEQAQQYQAGITDNQWLLLGILAGVIIIAVAVSD